MSDMPAWSKRSADGTARRSAATVDSTGSSPFSPRRCCLAMLPTTSTTAMPARQTPGPGTVDRSGAAARAARRDQPCDLLDADAIADVEAELEHLHNEQTDRRTRSLDGVHDMLLRLGDLSVEGDRRLRPNRRAAGSSGSTQSRRAMPSRWPARRASSRWSTRSRYRDGLGVPLPQGLPETLLEHAPHAALDLARCFARTHGPFTAAELADRYGLGPIDRRGAPQELAAAGRLLEGDFRPGGTGREWCDVDELHDRRRSLAKLRRQVEPVEPQSWTAHHALAGRRPPPRRPGRAARCHRGPAGRAAHRVNFETEDPAGTGKVISRPISMR